MVAAPAAPAAAAAPGAPAAPEPASAAPSAATLVTPASPVPYVAIAEEPGDATFSQLAPWYVEYCAEKPSSCKQIDLETSDPAKPCGVGWFLINQVGHMW